MQDQTLITVTCIACGKTFNIPVNTEDYLKYMNGELVQYAFPYLTADQRELLISQICGKCFDELFKDE